MGFRDDLEAAEKLLKHQAELRQATEREIEEAKAEGARLAQAMLPEVDEALAMLRSARDVSVEVLASQDDHRRHIESYWVDAKNREVVRPRQSAGSGDNRRWQQRKLAGWKVWISRKSGPLGLNSRCPGSVDVLIPVDGEPQVESDAPSASGPLREYILGGYWRWEDTRGGRIDREERADRTLASLLETLATHLAHINTRQ
jgi:hypothetical protein